MTYYGILQCATAQSRTILCHNPWIDAKSMKHFGGKFLAFLVSVHFSSSLVKKNSMKMFTHVHTHTHTHYKQEKEQHLTYNCDDISSGGGGGIPASHGFSSALYRKGIVLTTISSYRVAVMLAAGLNDQSDMRVNYVVVVGAENGTYTDGYTDNRPMTV